MHEEEETYTSTGEIVEEHPSPSLVVGGVITLVGGTLVVVQNVPKINQGMQIFPLPIISANHMEDCGNMPSG